MRGTVWGVEGTLGLDEVGMFSGRGEGEFMPAIDRGWMLVVEQKHETRYIPSFYPPSPTKICGVDLRQLLP